MAQSLHEVGENVALLTLVDAYPDARYMLPAQRIGEAYDEGNLPYGASRLWFEYTTLRVKQKAYLALESYRPLFYSGKIKFVKSETDLYYPANPAAVWAKLAAGFEAETVPGGHPDMLTGDIKSLAAVLTRYVNEALRPK
jgi:thioesterase domain-containing protein